jgi:hypothetical protein
MKGNLMRVFFLGRLSQTALLSCLCVGLAKAQDAAVLHKNTFEVGPFIGMSYGVDHLRVMGGGNVTYSILRNLLLYGEYSYFPSIQRTVLNSNQAKYQIKIPLQDVNFGIHLRIRIPKTPLVPYVVGGLGMLHSPTKSDSFQTLNQFTNQYNQAQSYTVNSSTDFAVNYGAGVRLYIRESFGFRGEFKGYRLTGGPLHTPSSAGISGGLGVNQVFRAAVGFFIQF